MGSIEKRRKNVKVRVAVVTVIALLALIPFYWFIGVYPQTFRVPTASMTPNILPGERVMAEKAINPKAIRRGEIAFYYSAQDPRISYVKRVIGIPGDKIVVKGNQVFINGKALTETKLEKSEEPEVQDLLVDHDLYEETIDGHTYEVLWPKKQNPQIPEGSFEVNEGEYFFMGDFRGNSLDSRAEGNISMDSVYARPKVIFFSVGEKGVRWRRIGKLVR